MKSEDKFWPAHIGTYACEQLHTREREGGRGGGERENRERENGEREQEIRKRMNKI